MIKVGDRVVSRREECGPVDRVWEVVGATRESIALTWRNEEMGVYSYRVEVPATFWDRYELVGVMAEIELARYWDGLHLRCNGCGRRVHTLKEGQTLRDVALAWLDHGRECREVFPAAPRGESSVDA